MLAGDSLPVYGFGNAFARTEYEFFFFLNIQRRYYDEILLKTKIKVRIEGRGMYRRYVCFSLTARGRMPMCSPANRKTS